MGTMSHPDERLSIPFQPPSYAEAKRRGKQTIAVYDASAIDPAFATWGVGKTYFIRTYGCQMNEHDSETIKGLLEAMGYTETFTRDEADVILLNTCAIREQAEDKVFGEIGHLKTLKQHRPDTIVGICGCMAQEEGVVQRILTKHPHIDLIFGTHNIHRLPQLLKEAHFSKEMVVEVWSKEGDIVEHLPKKRQGFKAWVTIMYGCDKFCTYCIVPYTRGKERSRRPQDVLAEVRALARTGVQEITLLGQNVNAYGKDFTDIDYTFAQLMADLSTIGIPRIRFTTSHPRDFDAPLIEVLARRGNIVEHIHLPVQSGNSDILKKMSRKYTRQHYVDLVAHIRQAIPDVVLTTDIIVGFPGETEEQFLDTLSLVDAVRFDGAYTFMYSAREGTPAAAMPDDISVETKKRRLHLLNERIAFWSKRSNEALHGQVVEVLVDGESKTDATWLSGRTRTNKLVHFQGESGQIGQLVHVRITEPLTWFLKGEWVATGPRLRGGEHHDERSTSA